MNPPDTPGGPVAGVPSTVQRLGPDGLGPPTEDRLAGESPLALHLVYDGDGGEPTGVPLGLVLRSPGQDRELAVGYAFAEGLIDDPARLRRITACAVDPGQAGSRLTLYLEADGSHPDLAQRLERRRRLSPALAGCGVCGSSELESLVQDLPALPEHGVPADLLWTAAAHPLPEAVAYRETGGMHSASLFGPGGELVLCREDVGRHNALDKLIGALLLQGGREALREAARGLVLVSGRVGWELVQKCLRAGLPALAARGAASDLAVALARQQGMLLAGFLKTRGANIHSGTWRIRPTLSGSAGADDPGCGHCGAAGDPAGGSHPGAAS
jgi:FdhD protein